MPDSLRRRTGNIMKLQMPLLGNGRGFTFLLAGAAVLATGCVERQVTYVQPTEPPPAYQPPPAEPVPPPEIVVAPAPVVVLRSPYELDQMVASIALYPDPLLAQILPAATVPQQIVWANGYVGGGGDPRFVESQPWDSSVRAVAHYPEVLRMMNDNLAWTTDLGRAFLNQPADVMNAVQRLRAQARALGNLYSTPEQIVYAEGGTIVIVPAVREVIYVPVYRPEIVYVERPPAPNRFYVSFGVGRPVGLWLNHDCDWHAREVVVWHHDHPRPPDYWQHRPSERPHDTHLTAWHAPAHHEAPPGHHEVPPPVPPQAHRPPQGQPKPLPVATHPVPPQHQPQPAPAVHSGAHQAPPAESRPPQSGVAHSGAHAGPGSSNGAPPAHSPLPPADPTHQPVRYPPVASSGPGVSPVPAPLPRPTGVPALKDPNQRPDGAFVPAPKDPRSQLPPRPTPSGLDQNLPARPVPAPLPDSQASNKNPNSHGANAQSSHAGGEGNNHDKQAHEGLGKPSSGSTPLPENKNKEDKKPQNSQKD